MPNFKPKAKKKFKMDKNTLITLDNKHNEKMNSFQQIEQDIIPTLKKQKEDGITRKLIAFEMVEPAD